MKKVLLAILLVMSGLLSAQTVWTVETVPNTRLQGNDVHVSDPDGFLSDSAEMRINTALCAIREQADVFVVTLASIGEAEPKRFATTLFNRWGIGDAETDNGVLLLFVEDQHALEFETGYGAEETLTDAKCERIFTKAIVPFFKAGDYEGGLCAGVAEIVTVYGGTLPDGLKSTLPDGGLDDDSDDDLDVSWFVVIFALLSLALPIAGFIFWVVKLGMKDKPVKKLFNGTEEDGVVYIDATESEWTGSPWGGMGCCGGLLIGLSIFLCGAIAFFVMMQCFPSLEGDALDRWWSIATILFYLTFVSFCHNRRLMRISKRLAQKSLRPKEIYETAMKHTSNQIAMWMAPWIGVFYFLKLKLRIKKAPEACCPSCGAAMQATDIAMSEAHRQEEQLGALRFEPYCCDYGHKYVMMRKGKSYADFTTCTSCGAYTCRKTETKTVRQASYTERGEKLETYVCQHCGDTITKTIVIPMLVHASSGGSGGSSSSSSSHRSYSSHHSSHGSFGGGHSGGGGFSGRW